MVMNMKTADEYTRMAVFWVVAPCIQVLFFQTFNFTPGNYVDITTHIFYFFKFIPFYMPQQPR
jgi:hypothetical protein